MSVKIEFPSFCDCFGVGNILIKTKSGLSYKMKYVKNPSSIVELIKAEIAAKGALS